MNEIKCPICLHHKSCQHLIDTSMEELVPCDNFEHHNLNYRLSWLAQTKVNKEMVPVLLNLTQALTMAMELLPFALKDMAFFAYLNHNAG